MDKTLTVSAVPSAVIDGQWRGILRDANGCVVDMCFCKHISRWNAVECIQWRLYVRDMLSGVSNHVA